MEELYLKTTRLDKTCLGRCVLWHPLKWIAQADDLLVSQASTRSCIACLLPYFKG